MKILFALALLLMGLSGCSSRQPEPFVSFITSTVVPPMPPPPPPPTPVDFIADLDFMLDTLRENFGYFDNARYELDFDIEYMVRGLQAELATMEEISVLHFYRRMRHTFEADRLVGHFMVHSPDYSNTFMTRELLNQQEYYSEFSRNLAAEFLAGYRTLAHRMFERGIRTRGFYRGPEVAQALADAIANQDFDTLADTIALHENTPPFHHRVLEADNVAYLAMLGMWLPEGSAGADILHGLAGFYAQIQDFPHLIIDVRGNTGGHRHYFLENVLAPLLPGRAFEFVFYYFGHTSMEIPHHGRSPINPTEGTSYQYFTLLDLERVPRAELLQQSTLPAMNYNNIKNLPYGFRMRMQHDMTPRSLFSDLGFDGQIWVLTDGLVGSGGHIFSYIVKEAGFATLVGEPTGGNYAGVSARPVVTMPNSLLQFQYDEGALFTSQGRSMEIPIQPHYPNRPGLCALETVLAMIAEQEGN